MGLIRFEIEKIAPEWIRVVAHCNDDAVEGLFSQLLKEIGECYPKAEKVIRAYLAPGEDTSKPAASPRPPQYLFQRRGEDWMIAFEGQAFSMPPLDGLSYIANLLRNPNRGIHVTDLEATVKGQPDTPTVGSREEDVIGISVGSAPDKIMDEQYRRQITEQLKENAEERKRAEEAGDEKKVQELDEEYRKIEEIVGPATGLSGKAREFVDDGERSRQRVQKGIKLAKNKIEAKCPSLFKYLDANIDTGFTCTYRPLEPLLWGF